MAGPAVGGVGLSARSRLSLFFFLFLFFRLFFRLSRLSSSLSSEAEEWEEEVEEEEEADEEDDEEEEVAEVAVERLLGCLRRDGEPLRLLAELALLNALIPRTTAGMAMAAVGCVGGEEAGGRGAGGGVGL